MSQRNRKRGRRAHSKTPRAATGAPANADGTSAPPKLKTARPGRPAGKPGGRVRQRWFYDVRQYAILTDDAGHILLLQLPAEYDEGTANTWTLPGGKLEPADEPLAGIRREIMEETALKPEVLTPAGITRWSTRNSKKLAIFYKARMPGTQPKAALSGEHQRAVWIKPEDLTSFPFHRPEMLETVKSILG